MKFLKHIIIRSVIIAMIFFSMASGETIESNASLSNIETKRIDEIDYTPYFIVLRSCENLLKHCSGSLISWNFISTTARCFFYWFHSVDGIIKRIRVVTQLYLNEDGQGLEHEIEKGYYPKNYRSSKYGSPYDLAILKFKDDLRLKQYVPRMEIPYMLVLTNDIPLVMVALNSKSRVKMFEVRYTSLVNCIYDKSKENQLNYSRQICASLSNKDYHQIQKDSEVEGRSQKNIDPEWSTGKPLFADDYLVAIVSRHLRQNYTTTLLCTLFEPHISIFNDLESLLKKSQPAWETISTEN